MIEGCYDQDGADYPLSYTFGYRIAELTARFNPLCMQRANAFFTSYWTQANTFYGSVEVCDAMSDCVTVDSSTSFTITGSSSGRRLKETSVYDRYENALRRYDVVDVLRTSLMTRTMPEDLIDTMWNDFTGYVSGQVCDEGVMEKIDLVVPAFMDKLQASSLTDERVNKYTSFRSEYSSRVNSGGDHEN